jgi:hypothetical protein
MLISSRYRGSGSGMKKVTSILDEKTAAWARAYAAQRSMRVSHMISDALRERMQGVRDYDDAMRRFLRKRPVELGPPGQHYARRDELHDRARLR